MSGTAAYISQSTSSLQFAVLDGPSSFFVPLNDGQECVADTHAHTRQNAKEIIVQKKTQKQEHNKKQQYKEEE